MQKFAIAGLLAAGAIGWQVRPPQSQREAVHGLSNSDPTVFTTAYVDISCPASDD